MGNSCDGDSMFVKIDSLLESLYERVDEEILQQEKQLEDCKRKDELESMLAQELKLNNELRARVEELKARGGLGRVTGTGGGVTREVGEAGDQLGAELGARLRLTDTDTQRLHTARELHAIGKELTGVRWDYSAPPDVAKGFIKSESGRWLRSFSVRASEGDAVWDLLRGDKENVPY